MDIFAKFCNVLFSKYPSLQKFAQKIFASGITDDTMLWLLMQISNKMIPVPNAPKIAKLSHP